MGSKRGGCGPSERGARRCHPHLASPIEGGENSPNDSRRASPPLRWGGTGWGDAAGRLVAAALTAACLASAAHAADAEQEIVVTARREATIERAPSTAESVDAARIDATVNAVNTEDTLKYLPSLFVRKRHIGDTQAPLATRTSGVGASARSLIYADGVLLSALIGNNNSTASPRWGMVSPEEIAHVDVLYGPFAAAYPGNSIGAVVNIQTRLPEHLEATATLGTSVQHFSQYATKGDYPAYQGTATAGDRMGRFAWFASYNHVDSKSQPIAYVTAVRPATASAAGAPTTGAFDDVNRTGAPIAVIGAGGLEHQRQDNLKLKLAFDLTPTVQVSYLGGLFANDTDSHAETYLTSAAGAPVYSGSLNLGGYAYNIAASAFSNNVYRFDERHWMHALSAKGSGAAFDWQVIGSLYDYDRDVQRIPTTALPGAAAGGAGTITRLDGTGWRTLDGKGVWRTATQAVSFGAHYDRFELDSNRYATADWRNGAAGVLNLAARGKTRTEALWLQDEWTVSPALSLTLGGRYEWWRAYDGFNFSAAPTLSVNQPGRSADRFSPKASAEWRVADGWTVTGSFGAAYRFPTVTELYQAVTTGPTITVPNPDLKPERALSEELAIEHRDGGGHVRLSLFNERLKDALIAQSAPLVPGSATLFSYVQNVDRVRARGIEAAFDRRNLLPGFDLSGSVTFVDPKILADAAFPAAIGKRTPQVPRRKATLVATWRPGERWSFTGAARYGSRSFATIDNSDPVGHTYQGFDHYFVVDARAVLKLSENWSAAVGVDNLNNDRYYLFHPFTQRSFVAELRWNL